MRDALDYFIRVLIKQGMWISGAAWLLAVGSWVIYARGDGTEKSRRDVPGALKRKIFIGVVVLIIGIVVAF